MCIRDRTNIIQLVRFAFRQIERLDSVVTTSKQFFNLWLGQNQREITDKQREANYAGRFYDSGLKIGLDKKIGRVEFGAGVMPMYDSGMGYNTCLLYTSRCV